MNDYAMIDKVYNFFVDKNEMEGYLRRINKGESPELQTIEQFLENGERYYHNPTLYHSLEPSLSELRRLQAIFNFKQRTHKPTSAPKAAKTVIIDVESVVATTCCDNNIMSRTNLLGDSSRVYVEDTTPYQNNVTPITPAQPKVLFSPPKSEPTSSPTPSHTKPSQTNTQTIPPLTLTPQSIHSFFSSQGIVGEEKNRELMMYGLVARANMGIESLSGSGKSALLYALLKALPPERYLTIHQATDRSLYHNPKINSSNYLIIPELQKIFSKDIEEIIKNLTEGVDSTYTRTNSKRNGVDTFKIDKKPILYSFAITNKHLKERDDEFYRRFIIFHTDISREQNKKVALSFAERELQPETKAEDYSAWQGHISACLDSTAEIKNPFLPHIIESLPPEISEQVRFRSSVKYLHQLICGATLFNSVADKINQKFLFSGLSDNLKVTELYEQVLVDNLYGLSVIDRALLDLLDNEPAHTGAVKQRFGEIYATSIPIEDSLSKLTANGLVGKEGDEYRLRIAPKITINPEQALDAADKFMQLHYPKYRDQWHEQCLKTDRGMNHDEHKN